jgi:hypothetical protein
MINEPSFVPQVGCGAVAGLLAAAPAAHAHGDQFASLIPTFTAGWAARPAMKSLARRECA